MIDHSFNLKWTFKKCAYNNTSGMSTLEVYSLVQFDWVWIPCSLMQKIVMDEESFVIFWKLKKKGTPNPKSIPLGK